MAQTANCGRFFLYTDGANFKKNGETYFYYEGYFLPRRAFMGKYSGLSGYDLLIRLFKEEGPSFVNFIKGFYSIVIIDNDNFYLYNDIHSVKRFFYYSDSSEYYLSNNLTLLARTMSFKLEKCLAAHHALFQHFTGGTTCYEGVRYSEGAMKLTLKNGRLSVEKYWRATELLQSEKDLSVSEFNGIFKEVISEYITYYKPIQIAATITGGRDTRTVLAALLSNRSTPHLFTFGNPLNRDVVVGKIIAQKLELPFTNPDISDPEPSAYKHLIAKIVDIGNPFIHLHRAHRLQAIEQVSQEVGIDMVFVGAMGGDYIKGASFDDYIISEFLRLYFFERSLTIRDSICKVLNNHFVKFNDEIIDKVENLIGERYYFQGRDFTSIKEFGLVHEVVGCTHDIQDISVFANYVDKVVAPYMDIDVLEALFRTKYSLQMNSKNSSNPLSRFLGGEFQAKLVMDLFPGLAEIEFANYYSPSDVSGGVYRYILRRGIAYVKQKRSPGVSGFDYGKWFINYVEEELKQIGGSEVCEFYDIDKMIDTFRREEHLTHEGHWHRYTNPITFSRYLIKNR